MATLGTLTLKLRATRKALALDLLQSKQEVEQWQQQMTPLLNLKAGVTIDWDSFSNAESEIRRWIDSLPKTDLRVGAKFVGADLAQNIQELERLLANPLKILVNDTRLFELNEHFKLKERDYKQLQTVLYSPLEIKVDRSQLDNLSRDLRSIENTPQVNLRANIDIESLRSFHEQLNRYSQGRTLELATSVSRTTLNALQNDLKSLASNLTTARVSVQIDSQLQALRSELGNLPNVSVGVSIDDSALGEFDRKLGKRQLGLGLDTKDLGKSIEGAVKGGFNGISSLFGVVTSPLKAIMRGAFEGAGRDLFGGVSKSFSDTINQSLSNTIGSTDLVGRKLGEKAANKFQQVGYQLAAEYPVIGATSSAIQKDIRTSLGERDVAIEANKIRGNQTKQKQKDLEVAREGITEERKAARESLQVTEKKSVKVYQDVKPLQDEIDRRLAPDREKQIKLSDIRIGGFDLSPTQKLTSGSQATLVDLDAASKRLRKQLTAQGLATDVVESRVSAEAQRRQEADRMPENRTLSPKMQQRMLRFQERIDRRREEYQPVQNFIDGRLEAAQAQLAMARDRSAAADAQAKLLKRQQQPKVYQDILDEIAPNLPDNLVPKLVSNPNAQAEGEFGRYNVAENQIYLDPRINAKLQSGKKLTQTEYKTVREELEHAKDLKFGQFAGYQSLSERRLIDKPVAATPTEEAAVALELQGYSEDVKPFERNAKIKTNRAYERYANESRLDDINKYVGAGGRKFSRQALDQFKAAESGLGTAQEVAKVKRVKLPALDKLETGIENLKLEHLQLVEEIQKAQAGTLSPQEIQKLETDLISHTNRIVSTRNRIKSVGKAVVKVAKRQDADKAKQSFEANRGSWDDLISLDTIGSKAKDAASNLGGSLIRAGDRALTPHVNNLLSQVPGQPGVIDYGTGVDSLSQLTISDYGKMARLGLQGSAGVAQKAGAFLQGAEDIALGILPGGKAAKKVIQNTALPAAAFATATHLLPGGEVAAHALQGGLQGLLGLPGAGIGTAASGLIANTIGQLPMLGGAAGAATSALVSGGIDLATSGAAGLLAPVLGGKLMLNAGQKAFKAIAPQQDNNKLQLAGQQAAQTALTLPQKLAEPAYEFVESGRGLLQAAAGKLITQSIEPLHPQLAASKPSERTLTNNPGLAIRVMPAAKPKTESPETTALIIDIEAKNISSKEAIEYAKKIQSQTKFGKEKLKEALKVGDKTRAEQIAKILQVHLQQATTELDEIRKALGDEAAMGTDAGNQLGQTKSVVTRASNDLARSISKNKLNVNLTDPELEILSKRKPSQYNVKQDPVGAGFEAMSRGEQAADTFDRAERSIEKREDKISAGYERIQLGGTEAYDPIKNLVTNNIDLAKNKLGDLRDIGAKVISVFAGFASIAFVGKTIADWGVAAFQAAAKMESLRTTIGAVTSSSFKAQATIARSTTESNKLGYNAVAGLENDAGFFASTRTTALELAAPDIMTGLKQYNRVMGVDENRAKLAQTAVVQMAGKGKITAEELFGQLAESSPGAVNVLSRSMGLSVGQLRKEMESGSLNANDALPRFGNQLSAESLASVDAASKSGAASVGRLQNSFASLQAAVGDKIMAPTIVGLEATTTASNALKNNIDTLGKIFAAALLSAAASAVGLSAGIGLANPVLGFLIRGLITSLPLLKTFALQTAVAYAAIEVFNTVMGSINDSSPFKSLADESEAAFAKISKGAEQTTQDINKLKDEIYGKDRSGFQVIGDAISGAFGGQTSISKKAADDTVNADRILDQNEKALKRKPPELTEANRNRRNELELELSVIRSQNANLTSKDRDKIDINNKREQELIQERSTLEKPINTRQAELQQVIKNTNNIIDSPLRNANEKALATLQLAEAEKEQRKLQQQLVSSASTLAVGLRSIGEGLQAGLAAIDLASINRKTQTYLAATQDVRNTGAFASANFADTNANLSAKQLIQQQAVSTLKSTIYSPENRSTVKALGVDPENVSQEQIDRLKSTVTDTRGQSLLGYLSKYQQVKTELAQTNQSLFESQYSYIKSIADYNKQLTDKVISLDNKLINLQLSARNSIDSLQRGIEESMIEIDRISGKAMLQSQKNRMQTAYNKFLEKLGISTDDIFEQIFQNYNSILDTIGQMTERPLNDKQNAVTAKYRQKTNENRKTQIQTEQNQSNSELRRQNSEEKLNNPLNNLPGSKSPPATSGEKSNLISPVKGNISSGFGWRTHPVTGKRKYHEGVDYPVPVGTSIKAAGDGVVTFAGNKSGYGYTIDLKHPSGETTRYAHASKIGVAVGQQIRQGEEIGLSGGAKGHPGSGTTTGAHLHFETRNSKGVAIDPVKRLKQNTDIQSPLSNKSTAENASLSIAQENINTPTTGSAPPKPVPKVPPLPTLDPNPSPKSSSHSNRNDGGYTNVVSSFYTPGEGGAINGGKTDIRGKYIDRYSHVMATRTTASPQGIPYGAKVELRNPANGKTTTVYNTDRGTLRPGRDIDLTPAAAKNLGVVPDGLANLQMRVISVPKGQVKDSYDLGGGIGSYDRKGNYTGRSGTIVGTKKSPNTQPIGEPSAESKAFGQKIINNAVQTGVDQNITKIEKQSDKYVADTKRYSDIDTSLGKQKLTQEQKLSNQQDRGDSLKVDTQILQNRNFLNRSIPIFNRKTTQLERDASAYNRSADRTPYQQLDKLKQQYGGTPDTTTLDTSITESQTTFDRIKEESRARRENILKQIQSIEATSAGWATARKAQLLDIKALRKRGENIKADKSQQVLEDNDRAFGTPQARQKTVDALKDQYNRLPSDGINSYDAIAPRTAKVLTDYQSLNQEYQPKTFNDNLQAQGRSIIERFKSIKDTIQTEYNLLGEAAIELETEIQAKLKAAGYAPQLIDIKDPERLKLLQKVAPEQTKRLVSAVQNRDQVDATSKQLDVDAKAAAARTVTIAKQREQINVDRLNTDYLESAQGGDIFARIQIDKKKFNTGKAELDLEFPKLDASNIDLYNAKLNQLTLETNTLRNAMLPLREASNNFFQDIFKGKDILSGIGDAFRNLAISILTNLQNLIAKQLGEQLFGGLLKGAEGIQSIATGQKPDSNNAIDISLNRSPLDEYESYDVPRIKPYSSPRGRIEIPQLAVNAYESYRKTQVDSNFIGPVYQPPQQTQQQNIGGQIGGMVLGTALKFLGIPGFADGGMVTSPTLALVGEGINNEAIVPLPNGRSIPVDLKGAGESSGSNSNISNAISVTIQNSGQAKETSRGDANAIASLVQNLVTQGLIAERRPGGLLA